MTKNQLNIVVAARLNAINSALATLDDEVAVNVTVLFEEWEPGVDYSGGDRRRREDKLYRCEQAHTSQADWPPELVPALWTLIPYPGEIPVWKQPTGAQDAYNTGDKVHYPMESDPVYVSTVDNNVWAPGVYGWELEE